MNKAACQARSMTAFARHSTDTPQGTAIWEVRSVNSRYLEQHFRLPDEFRALEPSLREEIKASLNRGKVEVFLRFHSQDKEQPQLQVNEALLKEISKASQCVSQVITEARMPDTLALLQWPGVLTQQTVDTEALTPELMDAFRTALTQLTEARLREGQSLSALIESRCETILALSQEADRLMPGALAYQRQQLMDKLGELKQSLDTDRLEQEILLLAQKADIAEETDRLRTHVVEVQRILSRDEPIGRRLDFMMQELNREANTLSSKALHPDLTCLGVEMKVLIEQMREQVQNIE